MKISIQKDFERARSIKEAIVQREEFLRKGIGKEFPNIVAENYYEIVKEICTAIFLTRGIKFIGEYAHKEIIAELSIFSEITGEDISLLDNLRGLRNGSMYYGKKIEKVYLDNNEEKIKKVITKLKKILEKAFSEGEK